MKTKSHSAAIVLVFNAIMNSNLFRIDGKPIDLVRALSLLARAIHNRETDESIWYLGDCLECSLSDLIIGAYWSLTEWHGGQASPSYAAMCALGQVFNPVCTSGPEPDSGEMTAYEMANEWFAAHPHA